MIAAISSIVMIAAIFAIVKIASMFAIAPDKVRSLRLPVSCGSLFLFSSFCRACSDRIDHMKLNTRHLLI